MAGFIKASIWELFSTKVVYMSRKGPKVGQGMLYLVEDCCKVVKSH